MSNQDRALFKPAVLFQIASGGFKISEGRFRFNKTKLYQAARSILDVDQCGTGRAQLSNQ